MLPRIAGMLCLMFVVGQEARADCLRWGRDFHGNRVCMSDDLVNRNPVIPEDDGTGSYSTVIAPDSPKCPADRIAVIVSSDNGLGVYKCAKDLTDPK